MKYFLAPTNADILHFGKGHDDPNKPGRGSGRFAWGSGKRPKQSLQKNAPKTEEEKQQIIRSGSARDILAIQSELTTDQLRDAKNRMDLRADLSKYSQAELDASWNRAKRHMDRVKTIVNFTSTGITAWDNFADIYNAANSDKKGFTKLPRVRGGNENKDKNEGEKKDKGKGK